MAKILKSKEPEQITETAEKGKSMYELAHELRAKDSTIRREISVLDIAPFPDNPYKVIENEDMNELTESIQENGILTPLMVRRLENSSDKHELISGHRRLFAAKKAGLKSVTPSTCTQTGEVIYECSVCGDNSSEILGKTNHIDENSDNICDVCKTVISPEKNCSHICHKDGFAGFIWKFINFFNKLFKINQYCECGAKHW